jgi:hypothetical protein
MNQSYLKHTDGVSSVDGVRCYEEPPGCMSARGTLCTAKEEEDHQCFIRRGLVAARSVSQPLGAVNIVLHVGWIWIDLAGVTSEFNRVCVVTFTGTCRIIDSYRVVVSWNRNSEE